MQLFNCMDTLYAAAKMPKQTTLHKSWILLYLPTNFISIEKAWFNETQFFFIRG